MNRKIRELLDKIHLLSLKYVKHMYRLYVENQNNVTRFGQFHTIQFQIWVLTFFERVFPHKIYLINIMWYEWINIENGMRQVSSYSIEPMNRKICSYIN